METIRIGMSLILELQISSERRARRKSNPYNKINAQLTILSEATYKLARIKEHNYLLF